MTTIEQGAEMTNDEMKAVARAIAGELGMQNDGRPFELDESLFLDWLDQSDVDCGKVARAAITAVEALGWRKVPMPPTDAVIDAALPAASITLQTAKSPSPWAGRRAIGCEVRVDQHSDAEPYGDKAQRKPVSDWRHKPRYAE